MTEEVLADAEAAAARGAELIAEAAGEAIAERGTFSLAVSGGHAPWRMFELLGEHELDWGRIELFQVDERIAPDGDPDRNLTHLLASLPAPRRSTASARCRSPTTTPRPPRRATRPSCPTALDLVHLGLGPDGHTASLIPGDPVLEVTDRPVATTGEYQGRRRMTLTYPAIDSARQVLWLVTGADKVDALAKLRAGDRSIPAGRVAGRATRPWSCESAARRLERGVLDLVAAGDEHVGGQGGGEEAVVDDARAGRQPGRKQDRIADLAEVVGDHAVVGRVGGALAEHRVAELDQVAARPKRCSSSGIGAAISSTGFEESAMTTKRSAAAATIFSRVWAPPPPLTSQPSGAIWSAPSIAMSRRWI